MKTGCRNPRGQFSPCGSRGRAAKKEPTRLDLLQDKAARVGLTVRTWGPGDGATRYRFFPLKGLSPDQGYFGPADGIFTALGIKEAETFIRGAWR